MKHNVYFDNVWNILPEPRRNQAFKVWANPQTKSDLSCIFGTPCPDEPSFPELEYTFIDQWYMLCLMSFPQKISHKTLDLRCDPVFQFLVICQPHFEFSGHPGSGQLSRRSFQSSRCMFFLSGLILRWPSPLPPGESWFSVLRMFTSLI